MHNLLIRKLDRATVARLKEIAGKKGIGLETLARQILTDYALSPELQFMDEKYQNLAKDITSLYQSTTMELKGVIHDNNYLMRKIISLMEEKDNV